MTDHERELCEVLNALTECTRELWLARLGKACLAGHDVMPPTVHEQNAREIIAFYQGQFAEYLVGADAPETPAV